MNCPCCNNAFNKLHRYPAGADLYHCTARGHKFRVVKNGNAFYLKVEIAPDQACAVGQLFEIDPADLPPKEPAEPTRD